MITFLAPKSNISWCPEFIPYYVSICKRSWFVAQTMTCRIRIRWQKLVRMLKVVVLFQEILEDWETHLIWRSIGMQIKSLHKYVHLLTSSSNGKSLLWFMAIAARPLLFFWRESVTHMPNHFYSKRKNKTKQNKQKQSLNVSHVGVVSLQFPSCRQSLLEGPSKWYPESQANITNCPAQ